MVVGGSVVWYVDIRVCADAGSYYGIKFGIDNVSNMDFLRSSMMVPM